MKSQGTIRNLGVVLEFFSYLMLNSFAFAPMPRLSCSGFADSINTRLFYSFEKIFHLTMQYQKPKSLSCRCSYPSMKFLEYLPSKLQVASLIGIVFSLFDRGRF